MYLFAELLHLCGLVCILCTPRTCTCMYVAAVRSCRCCVFKVLCCVTSPPLEIPALRTFCSVASSRPKIPTLRTLRRITPVQIARTQDVLLHHTCPNYPHSGRCFVTYMYAHTTRYHVTIVHRLICHRTQCVSARCRGSVWRRASNPTGYCCQAHPAASGGGGCLSDWLSGSTRATSDTSFVSSGAL